MSVMMPFKRSIAQLKKLAGLEAAACWEAMSVPQRRKAMQTVGLEAVVLKRREKHGPGFEKETIEFVWKKQNSSNSV